MHFMGDVLFGTDGLCVPPPPPPGVETRSGQQGPALFGLSVGGVVADLRQPIPHSELLLLDVPWCGKVEAQAGRLARAVLTHPVHSMPWDAMELRSVCQPWGEARRV